MPDLGPELLKDVVWPATDDPIPDSDMARLYWQTWNTHKFAHYIPIYDKTFAPYRNGALRRPVRMCEIGVARGGSLRLWKQYFHEDSVIVGIDADARCLIANAPENGIHVRIGDQADEAFLASVVEEFGPFDIILDDGSHVPEPTLASFRYLFAHGLADGGAYLVEDLFSCYVGRPGGWNFMDVVKQLLDVMHEHYARIDPPASDSYEVGNPRRVPAIAVPALTTLISSVEVYDSMAVIHRGPRPLPRILFRTEPW